MSGIPPAEHEANYYRQATTTEALPIRPESLR